MRRSQMRKVLSTFLFPPISFFCLFFLCSHVSYGAIEDPTRWRIANGGIEWLIAKDQKLPHQDHIEMSGRFVSGIVTFAVDKEKKVSVKRELIWPMLRTITDNDQRYRAYLKRTYSNELPIIFINGTRLLSDKVHKIQLNGFLSIETRSAGIKLKRILFPSTDKGEFIEKWIIENDSYKNISVKVDSFYLREKLKGVYGEYIIERFTTKKITKILRPHQSVNFAIVFRAFNSNVRPIASNILKEEQKRTAFIKQVSNLLVLRTPDTVLNKAFEFAKIRTSESLFQSKMGLVHSPGGGRYYAGVWANDQVEYAGPFFPFLGYAPANLASLTAYRKFASVMSPNYQRIPSSFEMEGDFTCCSKDRGDAAMYAFGASRFALALGDKKIAEELWPAIAWCIEYNQRRINEEGVVASETDEMEGRLPTGTANLSTSVLAYGGLLSAIDLGKSLHKPDELIEQYQNKAKALRIAIEKYFGSNIKGYHTYKYFKEHNSFRSWISLPLTMGILDRKDGTLQALFNELWTEDGLATEAGDKQFWDRSTLYGMRGAFNAGATETAISYLKKYSVRRLLGDHVPYPVEASPEGGQAHLAAESALYCRIFTEGLFGIKPTGLNQFSALPRLPKEWNEMSLHNIAAFGQMFDLMVWRQNDKIKMTLKIKGKIIQEQVGEEGQSLDFLLPSQKALK